MASPEAGPMHGRYWASLLVAPGMLVIAFAAAPVTSLVRHPAAQLHHHPGWPGHPAVVPGRDRARLWRHAALWRAGVVPGRGHAVLDFRHHLGLLGARRRRHRRVRHRPRPAADPLARRARRAPSGARLRLPVHDPARRHRPRGGRPADRRSTRRSATSAPTACWSIPQQQLLAGTQLEFLFRTPGGAELSMRADVRHVQHLQIESPEIWEAGCEFREVGPRPPRATGALRPQPPGPGPRSPA